MPFKPFRPPLIRKNISTDLPAASTDHDFDIYPPSKRPRLGGSGSEETAGTKKKQPESESILSNEGSAMNTSATRPPLARVTNTPIDIETPSVDNNTSTDVEAYYNVLWLVFISHLIFSTTLTEVIGVNLPQRNTKLGMETEFLQFEEDMAICVMCPAGTWAVLWSTSFWRLALV